MNTDTQTVTSEGTAPRVDSYKAAKTLDVKETIESFIDSNSLSEILTAIEEICYEKCEHLCSNWQDENAGAIWQKAAQEIGKANSQIGAI
jgi:hypothetical protein